MAEYIHLPIFSPTTLNFAIYQTLTLPNFAVIRCFTIYLSLSIDLVRQSIVMHVMINCVTTL